MKRFRFRFEPLLFKRRTLEEQAQQELARQLALLEQFQNDLNQAFDAYQRHHLQIGQKTLTAADIEIYNTYREHLLEKIQNATDALRKQRQVVETHREKLLKLHLDAEAVELVKTRDHEKYWEEFRKMETKLLDEFGSTRFGRQSQETQLKKKKNKPDPDSTP